MPATTILTYSLTALLGATATVANAFQPVATINGGQPPGVIARSLSQDHLLRAPDGHGNEVIVERTVRAPGTRTPFHLHEYGGTTCVLEGEMTLYLEGAEPQRAVAGQCYYMPSGRAMVGYNSGTVNAVLHDIFTVPAGKPVWQVVEAGTEALQNQFSGQAHAH